MVVEVLGSERPAAVVGPEPKGAAIGLAGAGGFGQIADVGADRLDPDGGGVLHGLQEIGGSRRGRCSWVSQWSHAGTALVP